MSTGFIAHLSLQQSVYIEDYEFIHCSELENIINDVNAKSYLLFPLQGAGAFSSLNSTWIKEEKKLINIIVIEGTWSQARVMLAKSPYLKALPRVTLLKPRTSRFKIRSQPTPESLSTIEAIGYALSDLGEFTDERTEEFLSPFLTMVKRQINFQKINSPRYRRKWEQTIE